MIRESGRASQRWGKPRRQGNGDPARGLGATLDQVVPLGPNLPRTFVLASLAAPQALQPFGFISIPPDPNEPLALLANETIEF